MMSILVMQKLHDGHVNRFRVKALMIILWVSCTAATTMLPPVTPRSAAAPAAGTPLDRVSIVPPGVVIDHSPQASGIYIGSPSLAILPNGDYVASHDEFGPGSSQTTYGVSRIFHSLDQGKTWSRIATITGAFWSTLFVHHQALYLFGTDREYGSAVLRRSDDGGKTWTSPTDPMNGLLRTDGKFHCAPVPVIEYRGRLWRAMEDAEGPGGWGSHFRAFMMSAPADADLLRASSWTSSQPLARDAAWNHNDFGGWLEGNAVVAPDGKIVEVLRVDTHSPEEKVAIVHISDDGKTSTFDPQEGLVNFPGGAKKFTIRYDERSRLYWSLTNFVPEQHQAPTPGGIRNTLALTCSPDLKSWTVRCILLYHPDRTRHGFQYVDWLVEGDDIIAVSRTAYDDEHGGAHNYHDANFLTFHRFPRFRTLTLADSVPLPEQVPVRYETGDFIVTGYGFEVANLANGEKAFSNRRYVWEDVPTAFAHARFTRVAGGGHAQLHVWAKRDATLFIATALSQPGMTLEGWIESGAAFRYSDSHKTTVTVLTRKVKAGEDLIIPQGNWTGSLLLLPPN